MNRKGLFNYLITIVTLLCGLYLHIEKKKEEINKNSQLILLKEIFNYDTGDIIKSQLACN